MVARVLAVAALGLGTVASAQPDLTFTSVTTLHQVPYRRGAPIRINFSLTNIGTVVSGTPTVSIRLSPDSSITLDDSNLGQRLFAAILPGATLTQTVAGAIPANAAPGNYFIGGYSTSVGDVNPGNNGLADPQTIAIYCPGDTDGNQNINFGDLNTVLAQFGQTAGIYTGDVNGDGDVNFADLNLVLANFGAIGC